MVDQPTSTTDITDWNRIASTYTDLIGTPTDTIYEQFKPVLWQSLGDLHGLQVLDVGCGYGWLSAAMASADASVIGVDGSEALLTIAQATYPEPQFVAYDLAVGLPPLATTFDRVLAHMVLMDIPDIGPLITDIRKVLKSHGRLIFTLPHPSFFNQPSARDPQTGQLYRRITGYLQPEVWRIASFGGHNHYHRSLTYYIDLLRINGMAVTRLYEPPHIPSVAVVEADRAFYSSIPVFLLIEARPFDGL